MSEEETERTTWVPIAIAGGLVAAILVAIFTIDGSTDNVPGNPSPSPSSSTSP